MSDTLRRLQQLHQAATPGPWTVVDHFNEVPSLAAVDQVGADFDGFIERADAELIAAMRNTLPALLDLAVVAETIAVYFRNDDRPIFDSLREALAALDNT